MEMIGVVLSHARVSRLADDGVARSEVDEGVGSSQVSCRLEDNMQTGWQVGRLAM